VRRATTVGEERRSGTIALFALGFRPFFLAAGLTGVLLAAFWVAVLGGLVDSPAYYDAAGGALAWHAHEMLFGYVAAVVAGFLLTSVRNWTGIDTPTGAKLGALLALWIAGRVAPFLSEGPAQAWIALLDLAFLPALMVVLAVPLVRRAQPRNFVFVGVLGVLTLANLLVHLQALGITWTSARTGNQLAVDGIVLLMTLIAGRVASDPSSPSRSCVPSRRIPCRSSGSAALRPWPRQLTRLASGGGTTGESGRAPCSGCCSWATPGSWSASR
jgi:uncharacterized protein involved in response to NO